MLINNGHPQRTGVLFAERMSIKLNPRMAVQPQRVRGMLRADDENRRASGGAEDVISQDGPSYAVSKRPGVKQGGQRIGLRQGRIQHAGIWSVTWNGLDSFRESGQPALAVCAGRIAQDLRQRAQPVAFRGDQSRSRKNAYMS